ncbi:MAG: DUF1549 domain-containing protein [Opitutaceae bacterium]|nr:DUF1549 domain-containing protein [Opitutaceae bacterium]
MPKPSRHPAFRPFVTVALLPFLGAGASLEAGLTPEQRATLPAAAGRTVDFARDIQPIFEASCVQCHGRGKAKGSFSLETRDDFLLGGDTGAPAVAGKSAESLVVAMVSGLDPDNLMPKKGKRLTPEQVSLVRAWIDQGMAWPDSITFFKHEPANLRARETPLPAATSFDNPVDQWIDRGFQARGQAWSAPVDDRTYARRVWFDAIGLPPPPEELETFVADRRPDKRAVLVARLLGDTQAYAEHWLTFWNDLLRNDYKGTGYIDGGRKQITGWLYRALARNQPYDQFVAELVDPGSEAEGFTRGILWRGAVNASMVPPMQASQNISQVFLGVNLKCASCHDSFINEYTLADAYGLASIYANGPLEIAECDKPTGQFASVKFLYSELGALKPDAAPGERKRQLAELLTGRGNGRLTRTVVNRLWQRLLGYGLVEPVDEMDKPAWSPELLDWLAEDLASHGYNLKHTLTRILTSRAYQLPSVDVGETEEHYVFRGPAVRRLTAEQFTDSLRLLTRTSYGKADTRFNRQAGLVRRGDALPLRPNWIWSAPDAATATQPGSVVFRRTFTLPSGPTEASIALAADDNYVLRVNGAVFGSSGRRASTMTDFYDLTGHLCHGENTIEITAENLGPDDSRSATVDPNASANPAGLIAYLRIRDGSTVMDVVSDAGWTCLPLKDGTARPVAVLGGVDLAPWRLGSHFLDVAAAPREPLPVMRAALVAADPLMVALGRPNREQVVTVRQAGATTLQALELTNGGTLAAVLGKGAASLVASAPASTPALITSLYRQALGRPPTAAETQLASSLVGAPARVEGVEDLLWALTMLPEFQLIR